MAREALIKFACKIAKYKASRIDDFKLSEAQKIIVALVRMINSFYSNNAYYEYHPNLKHLILEQVLFAYGYKNF